MKVIAVFLAAGILFISTFSGIYQPMKGNCCTKMIHQGACGHCTKDCCTKGVCGLMFSCCNSGFLIVYPVSLCQVINYHKKMQVSSYVMGNSLYYSDSGWHPPQV